MQPMGSGFRAQVSITFSVAELAMLSPEQREAFMVGVGEIIGNGRKKPTNPLPEDGQEARPKRSRSIPELGGAE